MCRALIRHRRAAQEFSPATCAFVTLLTVGGDVPAEDFGAAHAQRFALAVERRKMTIERPGKRTSIE